MLNSEAGTHWQTDIVTRILERQEDFQVFQSSFLSQSDRLPTALKIRSADRVVGPLILVDKSVPDDSVAYKCLEMNDIVEGSERWDIQNFGLWRVQAVPLPVFNAGRVRRVAVFISAE